MPSRIALLSLIVMTASAAACAAEATSVCRGPTAPAGAVIRGPVLEVPDGTSLCIAGSPSPSTWVAIPLAQNAPDHAALMAAAFGKDAVCVIDAEGRGRCLIEGAMLADRLRDPEVVKTAAHWR